ncbi:Lys-63-specific deubiquitinase BRCC36 [Zootermopsis nevadensis]|uniref:Lys-63-specific deubiquitinase BRCC36 n=1 Tax=Zootermopsis nevadensis TaxID=136037 RepID=A0A067R5B0_ZOONE|nr:Lys-63-specific deubiquitinase BRCC36 [Zootermopsis nevadensis]
MEVGLTDHGGNHVKFTFGDDPVSMVELPEILFQEEKDSYDLTTKLKFLSVLAQLNNKAVLTKALCHITEVVSGPLVTALEQRKATNVKKYEELLQEKQKLISLKSCS